MSKLDEALFDAKDECIKAAWQASGYNETKKETKRIERAFSKLKSDFVTLMDSALDGWLRSIESTDSLPLQKHRLRSRVRSLKQYIVGGKKQLGLILPTIPPELIAFDKYVRIIMGLHKLDYRSAVKFAENYLKGFLPKKENEHTRP